MQIALEKIWDSFERIKSIYAKDKKQSILRIVTTLSDEIQTDTSSEKCSHQEDLFFDKEIRILTNIGNNYKIRHAEINKKTILNKNTQEYLFFRVLNAVALIYSRMSKED